MKLKKKTMTEASFAEIKTLQTAGLKIGQVATLKGKSYVTIMYAFKATSLEEYFRLSNPKKARKEAVSEAPKDVEVIATPAVKLIATPKRNNRRVSKHLRLKSCASAPEYDKEEKITSWSKIIMNRLEEGKEIFIPDLSQELFDSQSGMALQRARLLVLDLRKRLENTEERRLLRCWQPLRYRLIDPTDDANMNNEHIRRTKFTNGFINSVGRSLEAIVLHQPQLLPTAKKMVWELENRLHKAELQALEPGKK